MEQHNGESTGVWVSLVDAARALDMKLESLQAQLSKGYMPALMVGPVPTMAGVDTAGATAALEKKLYTINEAIKILGVSRGKLSDMIKKDLIQALKLGAGKNAGVRIPKSEIERIMRTGLN